MTEAEKIQIEQEVEDGSCEFMHVHEEIVEKVEGVMPDEQQLLDLLAPPYIQGLTLLGGEPFEPENQRALLPFVRRVRARYPEKTIWAFSGFTLEELRQEGAHPHCEVTEELLSLLDVLVDGRFVEELKDISLRFRGSRNQRLIDMKQTLAAGHIVLLPDLDRHAGQQQYDGALHQYALPSVWYSSEAGAWTL